MLGHSVLLPWCGVGACVPVQAKLAITFQGEDRGEGFISLRKL